ncbi:MAG: hypothetical protein JXB35_12885 [Anaerolineae bacterium]|nr:hypothetical protein [Anaerolineae bacterium]
MNRKILGLRIAYWVGIVVDAVAAAGMIYPALGLNTTLGYLETSSLMGPGFVYGSRLGAPLMVGWTVLLFWADRKPAARKDVLLITLCPVVLGYTAIFVTTLTSGLAAFGQLLPQLLLQTVLIAVLGYGYWQARDLKTDRP